MLTYGDGVSNIDIQKLIKFHKNHGKLATLTSVQPEGRYGTITSGTDGQISDFVEKPKGDGAWINAGFFVLQPEVFDYIQEGDATIFERGPLESLARDEQLYTYRHEGFWKCMDTLRDKIVLQEMWDTGNTPWKSWKEE